MNISMSSNSNSKRELFKEGGLVYQVFFSQKDAAGAVLARSFCTEPVCDALGKLNLMMKTHYHDWVEFVDYWMDHCATNGYIVGGSCWLINSRINADLILLAVSRTGV